jgi:hypothetical protein
MSDLVSIVHIIHVMIMFFHGLWLYSVPLFITEDTFWSVNISQYGNVSVLPRVTSGLCSNLSLVSVLLSFGLHPVTYLSYLVSELCSLFFIDSLLNELVALVMFSMYNL